MMYTFTTFQLIKSQMFLTLLKHSDSILIDYQLKKVKAFFSIVKLCTYFIVFGVDCQEFWSHVRNALAVIYFDSSNDLKILQFYVVKRPHSATIHLYTA